MSITVHSFVPFFALVVRRLDFMYKIRDYFNRFLFYIDVSYFVTVKYVSYIYLK